MSTSFSESSSRSKFENFSASTSIEHEGSTVNIHKKFVRTDTIGEGGKEHMDTVIKLIDENLNQDGSMKVVETTGHGDTVNNEVHFKGPVDRKVYFISGLNENKGENSALRSLKSSSNRRPQSASTKVGRMRKFWSLV